MEHFDKIIEMINSDADLSSIGELINNICFEIKTDTSGNVIIHSKNDTDNVAKIMICTVTNQNNLLIKKVKDNKAEFETDTETSPIAINDKEVFVSKDSIGIIRSDYKDDKINKQYIELWTDVSVETGDFCAVKVRVNCKASTLYGNNLSTVVSLKSIISAACKIDKCVNELYFTASNSERQLKALACEIKPDYIFLIKAAETTDEFKISEGCGIVYKDGCAVTEKKLRTIMIDSAKQTDVSFQPYIGRCTTLAEALSITGKGAFVGGIYIPVEHKKTACQIVDINDINAAENLLINLINNKF